jgi:hypothetical protein
MIVVVIVVVVMMVMRRRVVALPRPADPDLRVSLPGVASTSTDTSSGTSTSTSTRAATVTATAATAAGAAVIVPGASRRAVARALEPVARVVAFAFLELERALLHSQSVPVARALADVERGDPAPAVAERLAVVFPVARRAGAHRRRGGV